MQHSEEPFVAPHLNIDVPSWTSWSQRPTIGLRTAVAMVHNFRGDDKVLRALKIADAERWKAFNDDLRTARKWLGFDPLLMPAGAGPVPQQSKARDRCEVVFGHFIEWVRTKQRLSASAPAALLSLTPPVPAAVPVVANGRDSGAIQAPTKARAAADGLRGSTTNSLDDRGSLALGLLIMYVRKLAIGRAPPPTSLLKGKGRINVSQLAKVIEEFADLRTDLTSPNADAQHGAKVETLRKQLSAAAARFSDNVSSDRTDEPV